MKTALKITWTIISTILKVVLLVAVILLLAPVGYILWRAGQPMSMPEYDGRTYYELLAERRQAYTDLATEYQTGHPNVDVKLGMCYRSELMMIAYNVPWAGFCSLAGIVPGLNSRIGPNAKRLGCGQTGGTWLDFPTNWWNIYERLTYDLLSHAVVGPVPYCRISAP